MRRGTCLLGAGIPTTGVPSVGYLTLKSQLVAKQIAHYRQLLAQEGLATQ